MRKSDFTLPTLDDLFSTQAERDDAKLERVRNIPLAELHPFKGHPFKVQNNEEMQRMIESIRKVGAITPALARPLPDGGYELISGHRRLAACQVLGVETMPVIVRELSDDEAVIAMVDANLQRETILPSEKAFAYKMKLDAIKHQGIASVQVAEKLLSVEKVADDAGESKDQVRRYIRLTYLIPELLSMVDAGKIAFNPAVELSYLDSYQQRAVLDAMVLNDCAPSHAQSIRLKKLAQAGVLEDQMIYAVLAETKPNQQEQLTCAWEALLPAITDEETLPESPMAHVLKKRLEKAEITPMLSSRNPWSEKEIEGKKFAFTEEVPGLVDFIGGVWIVAPQGGVTKTLRFEFAPEKANLVFEQDNGEFTAEIGLQSHFTSFMLGGRTYGAVGRWRSDKRFELEVRCAESAGGRRMIFTFEGDALTLETESTMAISGGIADRPYKRYTLKAE